MESEMELKLCIVKSCDQEGCIVNSIEEGEEISAAFSRLVRGRIRIGKDQLVALDMEASPKELVWRWVRGHVDRIEDGSVLLNDGRFQLIEATIPAGLDLHLQSGDEVWWCKTGEAVEVHAKTANFDHVHEERLVRYIHPIIKKHYSNQ